MCCEQEQVIEVAAGLDHLHRTQVDFVAARRRFDGAARLGERGRVENHHVILDTRAALLRQQVKRIRFDEVDDILQSVFRRAFSVANSQAKAEISTPVLLSSRHNAPHEARNCPCA